MAYRKTIPRDRQSDHQLRGIVTSVLRFAPLPQGRIGLPARRLTAMLGNSVGLINFEMQ